MSRAEEGTDLSALHQHIIANQTWKQKVGETPVLCICMFVFHSILGL